MSRKGRGSWMEEQLRDPFVRRAHQEGWRSRAVYKLEELLKASRVVKPDSVVVDLGAAPGAWSQFVAKWQAGRGRVIGVDLLAMEPLSGVEFIQGDFCEDEVLESLLALIGDDGVGVVLSDMAPNITGHTAVDQPRAMYLAELAMDFAQQVLAPGGAIIVKVFQGEGFDEFVKQARVLFTSVKVRKPKASRPRSREVYLVGSGFVGRNV